MLSSTPRINGAIMWANLYLLFWLSLVPDQRIERTLAVKKPE